MASNFIQASESSSSSSPVTPGSSISEINPRVIEITENMCAGSSHSLGENNIASSDAKNIKTGDNSLRGKNFERNLKKRLNRKKTSTGDKISPLDVPKQLYKWRLQVRLENGLFSADLKDALLRDLNNFLFSSSPTSFIPSFRGHGLRFGIVWFSPENEESQTWLKEKLGEINEKAGVHRFVVEPYSVHQNKISFSVPWDIRESLTESDVLKRVQFHNPMIQAIRWRVLKVDPMNGDKQLLQPHTEKRLFFCSVDDGSLSLIVKQKYRLNYGFQKIFVRTVRQKTANTDK